jgi:sugar/nucleoside kinase (ribokinase family)
MSGRKYDVLVAGELNVDIILNRIGKFPEIGKEVLAEEMTVALGSSSAIFASNLSVLGTNVVFTGMLARDQFGELVIKSLKSRGVNTDHITFTAEASTGATIAFSYDNDRAMVTYPGAMTLFSMKDIRDDLFRSCRHLHVSSIFLSTGLKRDVHDLFRKAKSFGLTTSLDPQWDPSEKWDLDLEKLLPDVDVFIPNEHELRAMTGIRDLDDAVEKLRSFSNMIIVKSGTQGAFLWNGKEKFHQPAFLNASVVDTIGAGDSFSAGFIHCFLEGREVKECLRFAALSGAINTTRAGGTGAFENLEMVKEIAQNTFNHQL